LLVILKKISYHINRLSAFNEASGLKESEMRLQTIPCHSTYILAKQSVRRKEATE